MRSISPLGVFALCALLAAGCASKPAPLKTQVRGPLRTIAHGGYYSEYGVPPREPCPEIAGYPRGNLWVTDAPPPRPSRGVMWARAETGGAWSTAAGDNACGFPNRHNGQTWCDRHEPRDDEGSPPGQTPTRVQPPDHGDSAFETEPATQGEPPPRTPRERVQGAPPARPPRGQHQGEESAEPKPVVRPVEKRPLDDEPKTEGGGDPPHRKPNLPRNPLPAARPAATDRPASSDQVLEDDGALFGSPGVFGLSIEELPVNALPQLPETRGVDGREGGRSDAGKPTDAGEATP